MIGKTIQELSVGDSAQIQKTISETDVYLYAGITGDLNPAHLNEEYAKGTFTDHSMICEMGSIDY